LLDDFVNDFLVQVLTEGQYLLDFIVGNGTTAILIEHLKCGLKFVGAEKSLVVHGCDNELRVIDFTTSISIDLVEHLINLIIPELLAKVFSVSELDFLLGEFTITVDVHGFENFIYFLLFLLGEELRGNECVGCLLEL
jgi:hypothetical protein